MRQVGGIATGCRYRADEAQGQGVVEPAAGAVDETAGVDEARCCGGYLFRRGRGGRGPTSSSPSPGRHYWRTLAFGERHGAEPEAQPPRDLSRRQQPRAPNAFPACRAGCGSACCYCDWNGNGSSVTTRLYKDSPLECIPGYGVGLRTRPRLAPTSPPQANHGAGRPAGSGPTRKNGHAHMKSRLVCWFGTRVGV